MLRLLIFLFLFVPTVSQASLGWFLLGGAVLSKRPSPEKESSEIETIQRNLPALGSSQASRSVYYFKTTSPETVSYFKAKGYEATFDGSMMTVHMEKENQMTIQSNEAVRQAGEAMGLILLKIIKFIFIGSFIVYFPFALYKAIQTTRELITSVVPEKSSIYPNLLILGMIKKPKTSPYPELNEDWKLEEEV